MTAHAFDPFNDWLADRLFHQGETMPRSTERRDVQTTRAERQTAAAKRRAPELRTISESDVDVLGALAARRAAQGRSGPRGWCLTADVGGTYHSQHANILTKLARHGLVERRRFPSGTDRTGVIRRVLRSRITDKGKRVLAAVRAVR